MCLIMYMHATTHSDAKIIASEKCSCTYMTVQYIETIHCVMKQVHVCVTRGERSGGGVWGGGKATKYV